MHVAGPQGAAGVVPVTDNDLAGRVKQYRDYVTTGLITVVGKTTAVRDAVHARDLSKARSAWLPTQLKRWPRQVAARRHGPGLHRLPAGISAPLFDHRYGLADRKPVHLKPMRMFTNDSLDSAWCHGDLLLQIAAADTDTVLHALRDIMRATRGGMQVRRVHQPAAPDRDATQLDGVQELRTVAG